MSDSFKEHRPLLREDNSEEEFQEEFRSRRHMGYKGKASNTVKGAAAIIKNWPDYWSSSVTYWWIGLGMFALMTFVLYSSVVTHSLLPVTNSMPTPQHETERKSTLPEVFMHVIVNNEKEINVDKYLPYIEIIANRYLHYQFNLIFMMNDTLKPEQAIIQSRVNNEDAMNSLWTEDNGLVLNRVSSKIKSNIIIQHVSLSNYLESSPVQEFWKQLPHYLIRFMVKAVSIWDKGGIAFSPVILTPRSPDAIYIEKLLSLLSSYEESKKANVTTNTNTRTQHVKKTKILDIHKKIHKKRVNNIRDIIDALETDSEGQESQPDALSAAEDRQELLKLKIEPPKEEVAVTRNIKNFNLTSEKSAMESKQTIRNQLIESDRSKISKYILPSFFDFLFHDKTNKTAQDESTDINSIKRSTRTISTDMNQENDEKRNEIRPMIISAPSRFKNVPVELKDNAFRSSDEETLTIDLKGNMLATKSSCHAFLGSVFSNVKHSSDEVSFTEFIIAELSLFCNGLLSTCKGIDVVLL